MFMTDNELLDQAADLVRAGRCGDALVALRDPLSRQPVTWQALYLAGQSHLGLNDAALAVNSLREAAAAAPRVAPVFLALGIALQKQGEFNESKNALARAIEIDGDYALAFNSLAMTQKLAGELEKALHNYDAGCKALARRIVKGMRNHRDSPIVKHRDTRRTIWLEHALYGALYMVASDDHLGGVSWLTAEQAVDEERTEAHGGLYWKDVIDGNGQTFRLFLPNYLNTFRTVLRLEPVYANLIGNRSTILRLMGREEEANDHLAEAQEFMTGTG